MDASVNRIPSSSDERVFLLSVIINSQSIDINNSLKELNLLVSTAGGIIVGNDIIKRKSIDPAHIIGQGHIQRIGDLIQENDIRLVVFDLNNIKPAQVRNLEEILKCRVIGRTEVILDIFAKRARSAESKIQVELAQLRYILPRLKGLGGVLSRLGGGIGTRGPGEKMLETDRRHIQKRISKLKSKLNKIAKHRQLIRKSRYGKVLGAVVGYTNDGKSTLINNLAKDDLFVEDRLFATLDSYTRVVHIEGKKKILLTDTVGFIRNLPASLIESFKSTLEEIKNAHFLIHVIDISSYRDIEMSNQTVEDELISLGCQNKPRILFFNKVDSIQNENIIKAIESRYPDSIIGSATTGFGIDQLKMRLNEIYDFFSRIDNAT